MKLKRLLSFWLAVLMVSSCVLLSAAAVPVFTDISGHWAKESIDWAVDNGITEGTTPSTFSPDASLTRAMYVTYLFRLSDTLGLNTSNAGTTAFPDVAVDSWYEDAVAWASERDIVLGSNGNFLPNAAISRSEIAVFSARFLQSMIGTAQMADDAIYDYLDFADIPAYATSSVALITSAAIGVMSGCDGAFLPLNTTTRAEAVTVIHRLAKYAEKKIETAVIGDIRDGSMPLFQFNQNDFFASYNLHEGIGLFRDYGNFTEIYARRNDGSTYDESALFSMDKLGIQLSNSGLFFHVMAIVNDVDQQSTEEFHLELDPGADYEAGHSADSLIHLICRRDGSVAGKALGSRDMSSFNVHYSKLSDTKGCWEIRVRMNEMGFNTCGKIGINAYATSFPDPTDASKISYSFIKRSNGTLGISDAQNWDYFTIAGGPAVVEPPVDEADTTLHTVIVTNGEKIKRNDIQEPNGRTKLTAHMARNEYEGMQFLAWNGAGAKNVSYTVSDLKNENGEKLKSVTLYREHYIEVKTSYAPGAPTGWMPDAIIPLFDGSDGGYANNKIDIAANQNQGFWFTVQSAKDQTAGLYSGFVTVSYDGGSDIIIPVEVTVWDITIPTEPSTQTCFDSYYIGDYYYYGDDEIGIRRQATKLEKSTKEESWYDGSKSISENLVMMYYDFFLDYRISGRTIPGANRTYNQNDFEEVKETILKYGADPRVSAFTFSVIDDHNQYGFSAADLRLGTDLYTALKEAGIEDKAFIYEIDEPTENNISNIRMLRSGIAKLDGALGAHMPNIITADTVKYPQFADLITDWCPNWGTMTEAQIRALQDKCASSDPIGKVWWYTCCGPTYPSVTYQIPDSLMSPRLAHWMQMDVGVTGELYWQTTMWFNFYDKPLYRDVWTDPCAFNHDTCGDGYLVYPGYQEDGIVNRNIPIPTLRLESLRDGLEDYELFVMMEKKLQSIMTRLGITNVSVDDLLNTYYEAEYNTPDSGYTNFADFDRENGDILLAVRDMLATDIMRDTTDCFVSVSNVNDREKKIVIYTQSVETVCVDGTEIAGYREGDHYVYSTTCNGKNDDILYKNITVGDESYTRILNYKY